MVSRVVKIGKSRGIRISKPLVGQAGPTDADEHAAQSGLRVVRPALRARQGWEEQFQEMAARGDDRLLDGDSLPPTAWEATAWEW